MSLLDKLGRCLHGFANRLDSRQVREVNGRPRLSEDDFHREYYSRTDVSPDTCAGVRCIILEQLRLRETRPSDNIAVLSDIDIGEILMEIGEEFSVEFTEDTICELDGTLDSLIRATQDAVNAKVPEQRRNRTMG